MAVEVKIPNVGESVTEVTLATWLVEDGAYVEMDDPIVEMETDKASQELFAETSGVITFKAEEGDDLEVGALIAEIDDQAEKPSSDDAKGDGDAENAENSEDGEDHEAKASEKSNGEGDDDEEQKTDTNYHASPVAVKILQDKGLDPAKVKGTGPGGKITKKDALNAEEQKSSTSSSDKKDKKKSSTQETLSPASTIVELSGERQESRKKMSRLRQTLAKRLVEVKNQTAMLTTFNEVDMTAVMELRKKYKEVFKEKHDVGLGFMSFFTKAVCLAARDVPAVNGKIDGDEIITYNYADVGIAVSTERGLVVPVIRDADKKNLAQIEKSVLDYALKARDNKISIDDMQGGTFTITNGGVFGSMLSTPIINGNQSAILGMHNIVQRPVAVNGQVEVRPVMYVALSYDHRIVDGKESVTFLYRVKELIEDPSRLLLEV